MRRTITFLLLYFICSVLYSCPAAGQTTYNCEIIWQKASPDPGGLARSWGFNMAGGDLNGDGYSDIVSATDSGIQATPIRVRCKIYIFIGGPTLSTTPSQIITYDSLGSYPSFCIADYNGDGKNDLALGDQRGTGTNSEKGQVLIHYGTGGLLNNAPDLVIGGSANYISFGRALSSGDINGDGIADLVVGAPDYGELNARGRVYVYYGDTLGLHTWPDIILNGHTEAGYFENFGNAAAAAELNHDGYDDLIIGAYNNCGGGFAAGKVYYYLSNSAPLDTVPDGWIYGEGYEHWISNYGLSSIAVDTLGIESVGWFGTPNWPTTTGSWGDGKCYNVHGDTTGELIPEWSVTGNEYTDSALGYWSCSAGYSDNDKLGDMAASALVAFGDPGKVYLWLRRSAMRQQYDAYIVGRGSTPGGDALGARVAPAGDVDSCGRDELLISNYFADTDNMIWLCKYTGPDANAVTGEPVNNEQLAINNVLQNSPNPFSHQTAIKYQIAKSGMVSLKVYNIQGQMVRVLANEDKKVGSYEVRWNGCDERGQRVSNGIYIYQLITGGENLTKKMILLR